MGRNPVWLLAPPGRVQRRSIHVQDYGSPGYTCDRAIRDVPDLPSRQAMADLHAGSDLVITGLSAARRIYAKPDLADAAKGHAIRELHL